MAKLDVKPIPPAASRVEVSVDQDYDRRLEEIAEIQAQIERMRQTSQLMRSRLQELANRLREMDSSRGRA